MPDDESDSEGTAVEPRDEPMLTLAREPSGPLSRSDGLEEGEGPEAASGCARVGESLLVGSGGSARSTSPPRGKCASEGVRTALTVRVVYVCVQHSWRRVRTEGPRYDRGPLQ